MAGCNGFRRNHLGHLSHHAAKVQQGENLANQIIDAQNAEGLVRPSISLAGIAFLGIIMIRVRPLGSGGDT